MKGILHFAFSIFHFSLPLRSAHEKPRGVSHAPRGSCLLVEVSQSLFKETPAQLPKFQKSAVAIAWALREPDDDISAALTQGRHPTGTNVLPSGSIRSRRKQRGVPKPEREVSRLVDRPAIERSRNVLEHRVFVGESHRRKERSVRARPGRCRIAMLVEFLLPRVNISAERLRNRGSAMTCSRWSRLASRCFPGPRKTTQTVGVD